MHNDMLLIPIEGPVELHKSDLPIRVEDVLKERSEGVYVGMNFEVDGQPGGKLHFLVKPNDEPNFRARQAMAWLTDVHIVLDGNVAFTSLDPALTAELVRDLNT